MDSQDKHTSFFQKCKDFFVPYKGKRYVKRPTTWKTAVFAVLGICLLAAGGVFLFGNVFKENVVPVQKDLLEESNTSASLSAMKQEKIDIVLDAGHGGAQPGCVSGEMMEKDITLSVTMRLKDQLEKEGMSVLLTRDSDEDVELSDRAAMANESGARCFVSIHCNWYEEDPTVSGLDCYYYQDEEGMLLAESILYSASNHSIVTRESKEENFEVLRDTTMPAVLIELGFMSNPEELENLLSEEYQETLASAIAEGILSTIEESARV